jgi:putative ABC transport system permease protein
MNPLRLSFLYLRRHLFTTLVTTVALALGIAAITLLLKLELLSHSRFNTLADQATAIVGAKSGGIDLLLGALNFEGGVPGYLPENLYETLKAKKEIQFEDQAKFKDGFSIKHISPLLFFGSYKGFALIGTDESLLTLEPATDSAPRLGQGNFPADGEAMVGSAFLTQENLHLGDSIYVYGEIHDATAHGNIFPLKLVGELKKTGKTWDKGIYTNLKTAQAAIATVPGFQSIWNNRVLSYFLLDINPERRNALAALINQRTVAQLAFVDKERKHLDELTGSSQELQLLVVGALLLLSALTVLAVFFTRVEARSAELAVLRAIGYSRWDLGQLLLLEGFWIGAFAIVSAAITELALAPLILQMAGSQLPAATAENWPWWMVFATGALGLIAMAIASLPPLIKLYRQDIHTTLRNIS